MTLLQLINNILRSIGEQPLQNSDGNLGTLAKQAIQSAIFTVVSQTRHSSFMVDLTTNVIEENSLLPAFSLPSECIQISNLFYVDTTNEPAALVKLPVLRREQLTYKQGYCIAGTNVYLSHLYKRPFITILEYYKAPLVEGEADNYNITIAPEVLKAIETTAAAWLSLSYLDDMNQQSKFEKLSQFEIEQLRRRSGVMRAPVSFRSN